MSLEWQKYVFKNFDYLSYAACRKIQEESMTSLNGVSQSLSVIRDITKPLFGPSKDYQYKYKAYFTFTKWILTYRCKFEFCMFVKFLQPQWGLICIYVSISLTNVPIVNVFCCAIHIWLLIAPWNTLLILQIKLKNIHHEKKQQITVEKSSVNLKIRKCIIIM